MSENSREICFFFLPMSIHVRYTKTAREGTYDEVGTNTGLGLSIRRLDPTILWSHSDLLVGGSVLVGIGRKLAGSTSSSYVVGIFIVYGSIRITQWLKLLAAEIFVTFVRVLRQIYEPFSRLTFFPRGLTRVILEGDKVLCGKLQRKRGVKIDRRSLQSLKRGS